MLASISQQLAALHVLLAAVVLFSKATASHHGGTQVSRVLRMRMCIVIP